MLPRSIVMAPSFTDFPATLWPPPRTVAGSLLSRANFTTSITSAAPLQRTIAEGCLSIMPFQTWRDESYAESPGRITSPRKRSSSSASFVLAAVLDALAA
jgi:hypothetical protein